MKNCFCILTVFFLIQLFVSCGVTKGYIGDKLPKSELGIIRGETNFTEIAGKSFVEKVLIAKVDSLEVGNYYIGWTKHISVTPGERLIEFRHFRSWVDKTPFYGGGAIGGVIAGSINEKNSKHYHYLIKFIVEKGGDYTIIIKTLSNDLNNPIIEVINNNSGEFLHSEISQKIVTWK